MSSPKTVNKPFLLPAMLIMAVVMVLIMVRLGVWQLSRADEKQSLLDNVIAASALPEIPLQDMLRTQTGGDLLAQFRFRKVSLQGKYLADQSILIDNQVHNKQAGYQLVTPFQIDGLDDWVMVSRGWLAAGATRQDIPEFVTPNGVVSLVGRINKPAAQPPIWQDGYPVNDGPVWQYLPIGEYASQNQASVLPLVVELAPENLGSDGLVIRWQKIDDHWVAKHKGYAFQWFSMAVAFFIACVILLLRRGRVSSK